MQSEETLSLSASFHLAKGGGGGVQASSAEQERSRSPLPPREVDAHALSAGSSPVSLKRERLPHVEIEKEEAAAKPPPPSRSGFRTCPQHSSEKLTLYAARARCFGCVKCFQEGVLRGHQGQSLQRAHEEVKEKLLRQHGTLLQQSRTVKENMQVNSAAEKLIEQERSSVHAAVKRAVENIKADLVIKSAELTHAADDWLQTKLAAAEAAGAPLRADIENIENEIAQLRCWCADDDDVLLNIFYMTKLAIVSDGEDARDAALLTCQNKSVPRIDNSHALKSCGSMSLYGNLDDDCDDAHYSRGAESGARRDISDAAELDRVSVIALGNTEVANLSPQDRYALGGSSGGTA